MDHTFLHANIACLYVVSVRQMALPLIVVTDIYVQLIAHLSTPKG